jgi:hypothetical protein
MINSISQQQTQIEKSNISITQNTNITQDLSLKTDKNATTLQQLQQSIDTQLSTVAKLLGSPIDEDATMQDAVLQMQQDANNQSDLIDSIKSKVSLIQSEVNSIDELQQSMTTILLALDEDKLLYTDDKGDLTLEGVLSVKMLQVEGMIITGQEEYATIGESVINKDSLDVFVPTRAVKNNSRIFITPKGGIVTQTMSVSQIDEDSGFHVTVAENVDEDVLFDWFIIEDEVIEAENVEIDG